MSSTFTLRLTLRFAVLVSACTALVLATGGWLLQRQARANLVELHEIEGEELGEILGPQPLSSAEVRERIHHDADSDAALFFIQVRDPQGNVAYRSANLGGMFLPALEGQTRDWVTELANGSPVLISDFVTPSWRIQIASRLEPGEQMLRDYAKVCGVLLLGVIGFSTILGFQFSRHTLGPVRAIEATARRIRADNLSERIPVPVGQGELTALIELLNSTFDRLQRSFDQVQRFTADASHELKTPLALARLNAEKLQQRVAGDRDSETLVAEVLDEITRLNRIIESLLFLARTEGGSLQIPMRPVDLADFLRDFAEDGAVLAKEAGVEFILERNDPGWIRGDVGLLRQLLLNLLSNSISVSRRGSKVTLDSRKNAPDRREITLCDEGPGLPGEQLNRVFERFVRYENPPSSGMRPPGSGLGLAICRGIAELHGGTIHAENRTDRSGLRIVLRLPEASAQTTDTARA